jgi:hypothetical protein
MAGWKMWFNNCFFDTLIGKCTFDFPFALKKTLDEKITFIQLYENQNEPHFRLSKKRREQFKEWIGFDKLVAADRAQKK